MQASSLPSPYPISGSIATPSVVSIEEPTSTALTAENVTFVVLRVIRDNHVYDEVVNVNTADRDAIRANMIRKASLFTTPDCTLVLTEGQTKEYGGHALLYSFRAIRLNDQLQKPAKTPSCNSRVVAIACGVLLLGVILQRVSNMSL